MFKPTPALIPLQNLLAVLGWLLVLPVTAADMTPERRAFFETKIRPVLVKQCYECHAVGAKKIGGKLLLDSPGELVGGGESGPAMLPGRPDESLIIQALRYEGPEMPPKHRLPESVVNDFVTWVKMGAPDPRANQPKSARKEPATDKASLWSFQPVTNPKPPTVRTKDWTRDPLDVFVLARIESAGLAPAKDAAPATLIRRLHFDLIGLPPTAAEVQEFVRACSGGKRASAIAQLVDRLLTSPHFGERWGRHWLDVARYGESNGNDGLSRNASFPHAWRFRDYVIQSFNDDVPYDRFVTEQIAGDLLPTETPAQRDRLLVATGFLALGCKPAKAMNDNFDMDVVADQIAVVGSGIMGLSVGCARCHDHKHDPIPARDYYALAGIFKSTETLWGAGGYEKLTAPETPLHELKAAPKVEPASEKLNPVRASKKAPPKPAFPYPPGAPLAMGVREAKTVGDCKLNIEGESKKLGPSIPRGFLTACVTTGEPVAVDAQQSGRLQLAQWLVRGDHPQTARVMANRVWQHLMDRGLVRTPDDFGVYGDRPSHPELLDHLATRFVADGWSVKRLIRSIVLSRTYQLDSDSDARTRAADPDNTLLARHNRRRLDAEVLRDAMLVASGGLDPSPGKGSLIQHDDVLINLMGDLHQTSTHRSVYLLHLRNSMPVELTAFNLPDGTTVTGKRDETTLPTQALYLMNSPFLVTESKRLAATLLKTSESESARIRSAFLRTLTREPSRSEAQQASGFLRRAESGLMQSAPDSETRQHTVWAAFCQALLASNELRYLD
ncbi:MAG: DUF1553 domain-containing protein [Proteobacteria bacterium]|nr:DUF1553 domain-containing protein [Pseudomonadota bacterium]